MLGRASAADVGDALGGQLRRADEHVMEGVPGNVPAVHQRQDRARAEEVFPHGGVSHA